MCDLGKRPCDDAALKYVAAMAENKTASDGHPLPHPDPACCSAVSKHNDSIVQCSCMQ